MRRFFDRFRKAPVQEMDWPSAKAGLIERIKPLVAAHGLAHQSAMDFFSEAPDQDGIRKMFRIHDAGGLRDLTVNWGYSFDFVPHVSGATVKWHRTFKSAKSDLRVVPGNAGPRAPRVSGADAFEAALPELLAFGIAQASAFWGRGHRLEDLPELLAGAAESAGGGQRDEAGFHLFKSLTAEPFVLARCGQLDAARTKLADVIPRLDASGTLAGALEDMLGEVARP